MNKRSFFKSLALMAAGAVTAPAIFIPKFEPVKWKTARGKRFVPNPNWRDADEPIGFIVSPGFSRAYYGEWRFVTTTFRFQGGMFVPDDAIHFKPYPASEQPHPGRISVIES